MMTAQGRLTIAEEAACHAALGLGAEPLAYVCSRLYLFVSEPRPKWAFAGISGALFLIRSAGRHYFALVDLKEVRVKFVHELAPPFEMQFMTPRFYCFHSEVFAAVVGIKACEGGTDGFVDAVTAVVAEQAARRRLNTAGEPRRKIPSKRPCAPPRTMSARRQELSVEVPRMPSRRSPEHTPVRGAKPHAPPSTPGGSTELTSTPSGRSVVDIIDEMYMEATAKQPRAAEEKVAAYPQWEGGFESPLAGMFSSERPSRRRGRSASSAPSSGSSAASPGRRVAEAHHTVHTEAASTYEFI